MWAPSGMERKIILVWATQRFLQTRHDTVHSYVTTMYFSVQKSCILSVVSQAPSVLSLFDKGLYQIIKLILIFRLSINAHLLFFCNLVLILIWLKSLIANAPKFDNSITRGNFRRSGEWMGWVGEKLEQCKDQPKYPISFLSPHKLLSKCRIRRKNVSSLDPNGNNYFNQTKPLFSINWWVMGEQDTFLSTLPPLEH